MATSLWDVEITVYINNTLFVRTVGFGCGDLDGLRAMPAAPFLLPVGCMHSALIFCLLLSSRESQDATFRNSGKRTRLHRLPIPISTVCDKL